MGIDFALALWAIWLLFVALYAAVVFPVPWFLLRRWRWGRRLALAWGAIVWVCAVMALILGWFGLFGWLGTWFVAVLATGGLLALVLLRRKTG